MNPRDLHTAALKATEFAKLALAHLSEPRPERLEVLRLELIEALGKLPIARESGN